MFINYTNHPSALWGEAQLEAARKYGEIMDMPFPAVDPHMDREGVDRLAEEEYRKIAAYRPDCVLCQGEFCLAYSLVARMKENGIRAVAACTVRNAREVVEDGRSMKTTVFEFIQFREY